MIHEKTFINVKQLSEVISIPQYTIRKLVREGKLPAYRITNKNYLFDPDEVREVIKKTRLNN